MNSNEKVVDHDMVRENTQPSIDLLLQILQETQLKLDNMERRTDEMAAQIGHNQEETQSSPPLKTETEVYGYNKKTSSPTQTEKQKKQEK
jgi:hypothetical protein